MDMFLKAVFGSKLYGTNIPTSDTDYKFLFLPSQRDLVLQRASRNIQQGTKSSTVQEKNSASDIDCEGFSLQQWLHMVSQGQTFATEMLFIPGKFVTHNSRPDIWDEIQKNKHRLISKSISPFVGYCRAQASKYCVKAERMQAAKMCADFFSILPSHSPIEDQVRGLEMLLGEFVELQQGNPHHNDNWFSCCGRKVPLTANCKRAADLFSKLYEEYGARAKQAAENHNLDYKALYHSLRIACEAHELLITGNLTFPRPESNLLLAIREGKFSYQDISDFISNKVYDVDNALKTSELREKSDLKWVDDFVYSVHMEVINNERSN